MNASDYEKAIRYALLVKAAEDILPGTLQDAAGTVIPVTTSAGVTNYPVMSSFYGNDLPTDLNPARRTKIVSFGLILQAANNDIVLAIRGTEGIWEWIHDAQFATVQCPFLAGAGRTEDGFTLLYQSLRMTADPASMRLADYLSTLPAQTAVGNIAICGHSLGASLATLLALDVASNTVFKDPEVFLYASPRTGDSLFASTYNQVVKNSMRITHRVDLVPKLPLPPQYDHVDTRYELNSITLSLPPRVLVKMELACAHHLTTYLYLLSLAAGDVALPLNPECKPL